MARILSFTVEVTDGELSAFLDRMASKGALATTDTAIPAGAGAATATDENDEADDETEVVDNRITPHLESVHAATKGKNADGSWKRKKGVSKEEMEAAEKAWRVANPVGGGAAEPTFTVPGSLTGGAAVTLPNPDQPVTMPGMPGAGGGMPSMPEVAPAPVSYQDVATAYQAAVSAGKLDAASIGALYQRAGVTDANALVTDETLRRAVLTELQKL